jgi:putative transposase
VAQKKVRGFALEHRRQLIGSDAKLSLSKQCELLGVGRSSWYYPPRGESAENLALMRALDELYTRWPFYGVRRMTIALQAQGWVVNPKRTRRLMRLMGHRSDLSQAAPEWERQRPPAFSVLAQRAGHRA